MTMPLIINLDKKISARSIAGGGTKLTAAELDLLVSLGVAELLATAKANYLKEQARCRDARTRSIDGGSTGSHGTSEPTARAVALTSPSSGTTKPQDASAAVQRARRPRRTG